MHTQEMILILNDQINLLEELVRDLDQDHDLFDWVAESLNLLNHKAATLIAESEYSQDQLDYWLEEGIYDQNY